VKRCIFRYSGDDEEREKSVSVVVYDGVEMGGRSWVGVELSGISQLTKFHGANITS
jgi:hypothetical protein